VLNGRTRAGSVDEAPISRPGHCGQAKTQFSSAQRDFHQTGANTPPTPPTRRPPGVLQPSAAPGSSKALGGPRPGRPVKPVVIVLDNGPIRVSKATITALYLVELRGFEPMAIAGAVKSRAIPLFASQCGSRLAARAFSIAIDVLVSVALFWLRSLAVRRLPRHKMDRSRRGGDAANTGSADGVSARLAHVQDDRRALRAGKRGLWRKAKWLNRQEFVVVGWSDLEGSRPHLGALLLGYYTDDGKLIYAGRVGTGMPARRTVSDADSARVLARSAIISRSATAQYQKQGWTKV
jgi:hypothetical protein